jgi:hypothetical protein
MAEGPACQRTQISIPSPTWTFRASKGRKGREPGSERNRDGGFSALFPIHSPNRPACTTFLPNLPCPLSLASLTRPPLHRPCAHAAVLALIDSAVSAGSSTLIQDSCKVVKLVLSIPVVACGPAPTTTSNCNKCLLNKCLQACCFQALSFSSTRQWSSQFRSACGTMMTRAINSLPSTLTYSSMYFSW